MSHFSTIKTQLKEVEPLIKALNHFGYSINQEEKFVKGYKGQFTAVDISMNLPGDTQVGFKWDNNSNSYELVTDLDLWKFEIPVERFISKVTQMYAYKRIISKTQEDGYQIVEQKKVENILNLATQYGLSHVETAKYYGTLRFQLKDLSQKLHKCMLTKQSFLKRKKMDIKS